MKEKNKLLFLAFIFLYVIILFLINQNTFHHDSLQLKKAIDNNNISNVVNNRIGMYYLYKYFGFTLLPIIISISSVFLIYLILKKLHPEKARILTVIFSFIPGFLSISSYPNSNSVSVFLLLLSLYLYLYDYTLYIIPVFFAMFFRIESALIIPLYIYLEFKNKNKLTAYLHIIAFVISLFFFNTQGNVADFNFTFNFIFIAIFFSTVGMIGIIQKIKYKDFFVASIFYILPFLFIPTSKARMIIFPVILLLMSFENKHLIRYVWMITFGLFLIFNYATVNNLEKIITENRLCKDVEYGDYSIFFNYYGSDECNAYYKGNYLLYHNSDVFSNKGLLHIVNNTIVDIKI